MFDMFGNIQYGTKDKNKYNYLIKKDVIRLNYSTYSIAIYVKNVNSK